jgi:hypothetical protein
MLSAAWVTAFATVGLLLGAIVTAWYAVKTFTAQAGQLKILELQRRDEQALTRQQIAILDLQAQQIRGSLEDHNTQAERDHLAQAQRVMVWQTREPVGPAPGRDTPWRVVAHVDNRSGRPVTDVEFRFRGDGIRTDSDRAAPLDAGEQATSMMKAYATVNAAVYFRDANGVRWRRDAASGELTEISPGEENLLA